MVEENVAVLGFRLFKIREKEGTPRLGSMYSQVEWSPGENKAFCLRTKSNLDIEHSSPSTFCSCGLQAYNEIGELPLDPAVFSSFAVGLVAGAGKVCVHDRGWRAEKATVVALCMPEYKYYPDDLLQSSVRDQEKLAEYYGVPLIRSSAEFRKIAEGINSAKLISSPSTIKNKIFPKRESVMNELFQNCFKINSNSFRIPKEVSFIDLMLNREDNNVDQNKDVLETKTDVSVSPGELYLSSLNEKESILLNFYQKVSWPGIHIAMILCMLLLAFSPLSSLPLALIGIVLFSLITVSAAIIFWSAYRQHQRILQKIRLENGF